MNHFEYGKSFLDKLFPKRYITKKIFSALFLFKNQNFSFLRFFLSFLGPFVQICVLCKMDEVKTLKEFLKLFISNKNVQNFVSLLYLMQQSFLVKCSLFDFENPRAVDVGTWEAFLI